jgi:hypothetical protein
MLQCVAERMRRIGGHDEDVRARRSGPNGVRGGARGLSDAAFTSEEHEPWG